MSSPKIIHSPFVEHLHDISTFIVHVTNYSRKFLHMLDDLGITWMYIKTCYPWIEFEAKDHDILTMIHAFPCLTIDILE